MAELKLVVNNPVPSPHPRPFQTYYYRSCADKPGDWSRIGRAASPEGVIRASVVRLVTGQYAKAVVHREDGVTLYTLTRKARKIDIIGLFTPWKP
jgi:hypothetical protein